MRLLDLFEKKTIKDDETAINMEKGKLAKKHEANRRHTNPHPSHNDHAPDLRSQKYEKAAKKDLKDEENEIKTDLAKKNKAKKSDIKE